MRGAQTLRKEFATALDRMQSHASADILKPRVCSPSQAYTLQLLTPVLRTNLVSTKYVKREHCLFSRSSTQSKQSTHK
eukprot:3235656-Rhodomonas_salina.2